MNLAMRVAKEILNFKVPASIRNLDLRPNPPAYDPNENPLDAIDRLVDLFNETGEIKVISWDRMTEWWLQKPSSHRPNSLLAVLYKKEGENFWRNFNAGWSTLNAVSREAKLRIILAQIMLGTRTTSGFTYIKRLEHLRCGAMISDSTFW